MVEMVRENPAQCLYVWCNQSGMQDKGVEFEQEVYVEGKTFPDAKHLVVFRLKKVWQITRRNSMRAYHKQLGNRLLEPFQV